MSADPKQAALPWWMRVRVYTLDGDRLLRTVDELAADRARRGIRAWQLATTLDIYHALMRGEDVPVELLNPEAVRRYGIRRGRAA